MKIHHISDTHNHHQNLILPSGIDILVFTGDESNNRNPLLNLPEFISFLQWFSSQDAKHKLFIPGNHSTFIYTNESYAKEMLKKNGIVWMHKQEKIIDGIKFYGDAVVPRYGDWVYMTDRNKMNKHWQNIPDDVEILLTHTPPKGILDTTINRDHSIEIVGCSALRKRVAKLPKLKAHFFGHVHDYRDIVNTGFRIVDGVHFGNGAVVKDAEFEKGANFHGNTFEIV